LWDPASGRQVLAITGHTATVRAVALSPDGKLVAGGDDSGRIQVWDSVTARPIGGHAVPSLHHTGPVTCLAFGPGNADLASGGVDREVALWDAVQGNRHQLLRYHEWDVTCIAVGANHRIVSGGRDRAVWIQDTDAPLGVLRGHSGPVLAVALSPDGQRIFTGSADGTARIWDLAPPAPRVLTSNSAGIASLAYAPRGEIIATGSNDGTVRVWDLASGRNVTTIEGLGDLVFAVSFSPDGKRLAISDLNRVAQIRDARTGRLLLTLEGHRGAVTDVAYLPDGRHLVTGSLDQKARIWDAETGKSVRTLEGHSGAIRCVAVSRDSRRVLTGGWDWTGRVWDVATGRELVVLRGHRDGLTAVAFAPDGERVATVSWDRTERVWDAASGRELLKFVNTQGWLGTVEFSPNGRRILTSGIERSAKLRDASTGREILTFGPFSPWYVVRSAFAPSGQRIVASNLDHVLIWDAAPAEQIADWEGEERAAEGNQQEALRERAAVARKNGFIQDWLLLAPFALRTGETGAQAVDRAFLAHENELRPRAGDRVQSASAELVWRSARVNDYFIDLNGALQQRHAFSAAYAVAYIESDSEHRDVRLGLGFDDQVKVYLNGRDVYAYRDPGRICEPDQVIVPNIILRRGTNVLALKVVNEDVDWKAAARFLGPDGRPIPGIRVRSFTAP
jgi:WD40 repeat protein